MQQVAASGKEWHRLAHDLDEFRSQSRTICSVLLWGSVEYNWLIVGPGNALLHTLRAGAHCAARPRVRRAAAFWMLVRRNPTTICPCRCSLTQISIAAGPVRAAARCAEMSVPSSTRSDHAKGHGGRRRPRLLGPERQRPLDPLRQSAFVQDGLDLGPELTEIALDHRPDDVEVDVEIAVGEDVAHPDDLTPGHLGVVLA